jgi:Na+/proline symporter
MLTVATWAFTLAAAGLFPALVAGLWWRRANAFGAAAAMLVGLAVAVFYLVGTRYFAVSFFEVWGSLSSTGPTAREIFGELNEAWIAAAPGAAKDAAWAALEAHAQTIANLWGTNGLATALLALPAAIVALVVVSLATPDEGVHAVTVSRTERRRNRSHANVCAMIYDLVVAGGGINGAASRRTLSAAVSRCSSSKKATWAAARRRRAPSSFTAACAISSTSSSASCARR